jgi:hypothetical protein
VTVVADVQALLPHSSAVVSEAVAVGPAVPKLSPLIVTAPPPLGAPLAEVVLTTGAAAETLNAEQQWQQAAFRHSAAQWTAAHRRS